MAFALVLIIVMMIVAVILVVVTMGVMTVMHDGGDYIY